MSGEDEPVGSVAEEAMKLLAALQGAAKEDAFDASSAAAGASSILGAVNEHIATGSADCKYCPVCQLISVAREVSPEVKQHLSSAAISMMQALNAAMKRPPGSATPSHGKRGSSIEHIELDDSTEL